MISPVKFIAKLFGEKLDNEFIDNTVYPPANTRFNELPYEMICHIMDYAANDNVYCAINHTIRNYFIDYKLRTAPQLTEYYMPPDIKIMFVDDHKQDIRITDEPKKMFVTDVSIIASLILNEKSPRIVKFFYDFYVSDKYLNKNVYSTFIVKRIIQLVNSINRLTINSGLKKRVLNKLVQSFYYSIVYDRMYIPLDVVFVMKILDAYDVNKPKCIEARAIYSNIIVAKDRDDYEEQLYNTMEFEPIVEKYANIASDYNLASWYNYYKDANKADGKFYMNKPRQIHEDSYDDPADYMYESLDFNHEDYVDERDYEKYYDDDDYDDDWY